MKLYPAIDLLDGSCVRLSRGSFEQKAVYSDDPVATAHAFESGGAEYLHVVDLSGARRPELRQFALVTRILGGTRLKVQVGGGLRTFEDAAELLRLGADRVVLGSAAVAQPEVVARLIERFGGERVTVALDVRIDAGGALNVAVHGWAKESGLSFGQAIEPFLGAGLQRVLCTDIDRDGTMSGPNTELYARLLARFPAVDVQASGGIAKLEDLAALKRTGVGSAVAGKALYEGAFSLEDALEACEATVRC